MRKPELLVFDFGNVLIELDYPGHFRLFQEYFGQAWPQGEYPVSIHAIIKEYEKGLVSDDRFIWQFQQLNPRISGYEVSKAWNKLIGTMKDATFTMLEELAKDYKLALLSNINSLHLRHIQRYLSHVRGIDRFESSYFDWVFYSHKIRMRKPDKEIYAHVESVTEVKPQDILFVDDRTENIEQAKRQGWQAVWHNPEYAISEKIQDYLV